MDLGETSRAFCDGCHVPPEATSDGLSCITCHAAVGNRGTENGQLVLDLDGPVRGPTGHGERAPHAVAESGFLKSPDLCGTCHDAKGVPGFAEAPFASWQSSPASKLGVSCADCHMQREPGLAAGGSMSHLVVGFDDVPPDDASSAGAKLGARVLSIEIELESTTPSAPQVDVAVHHSGSGHAFPSGATFVRELWISLEVFDSNGAPWFESGTVGAQERVQSDDGAIRWLSSRTVRSGSEVASPTEAERLEHHGIAPESTRHELFSIVPPTESWTARACVRLRRYRPDMLDALGIHRDQAGPVIDLKCAERAFD